MLSNRYSHNCFWEMNNLIPILRAYFLPLRGRKLVLNAGRFPWYKFDFCSNFVFLMLFWIYSFTTKNSWTLWTFVETFTNFVFLFMILFWICSQSLLFTTSIKVLLQHRIFQFFITYSSHISIINGASCQRVWFFLRGGWKDGNKKNFLKFSLLFCSVLLELLYLGILLSRLILCSCFHLECGLHRIKFFISLI